MRLVLFVALFASAVCAQDARVSELLRKPGEGERCLVCGQFIRDGEVVELRFKGRTFHVATPMLEEFLGEPERYFKVLQARGALFDEEQTDVRIGRGWLWFGGWALAGVVFGALCGFVAVSRGRSALPWFFAGLVGNALALIVLVTAVPRAPDAVPLPALTKAPTTAPPSACPECGADNHPSAGQCSQCGAKLAPTRRSEVALLREGGRS